MLCIIWQTAEIPGMYFIIYALDDGCDNNLLKAQNIYEDALQKAVVTINSSLM